MGNLPMFLLLTFLLADPSATASADDPNLWLEEVDGKRALEWVAERNRETLGVLEADPRFAEFKREAESLLQDKERIPYGHLHGDHVYNFWQDQDHVRGLWRRTTLDEYKNPDPQWETLLDVDQLAKDEHENWVFKHVVPLEPEHKRAMIVLSRGGSDASVWREFDIDLKQFLKDGFAIPQAKTTAAWFGPDTLAVATDYGKGSLTNSGYPRIVKLWRRDQPTASARMVFEAGVGDVSAGPGSHLRPGSMARWIGRSISTFDSEYLLFDSDDTLHPVPLPTSAELAAVFDRAMYFLLRDALPQSVGKPIPKGSLVRLSMDDIRKGEVKPETVLAPNERQSIQSVSPGKEVLNVALLNNVAGEIRRHVAGHWTSLALPANGNASIVSTDHESDRMLVGYTSFLDPPKLYLVDGPTAEPKVIKTLPERFDASGLVVHRRDATSKDGTKVPYFIVQKKDMKLDGTNPTLLYAYGGFEIPTLPNYSATIGKLWLEKGGVYVSACIRGGGEFGPDWHQAALKTNRQRAYDDFLAVAEDLVQSKITSPKKLGIMGGSNGGLLVGAAFTQRPDLFGAVVCSVPLLDMIRYTKLLAGASWIGEYGDPADPKMADAILAYSPYQNVKAGVKYPEVFFETSTKDDRVHPGHARKMVARMRDQGHKVFYFENTEGGHSAAANLLQRARRIALEFTYLHRMLMDPM